MTGTDVDVAGAWVDHLRSGGTTPWMEWRASHPSPPAPVPPVVPGAQQLELLRRLNLAGPVPPGLATRVLEASAPGRGRPDLLLAGAAVRRDFGPDPVDPAELPGDELLRVLAGLLAENIVAGAPGPGGPVPALSPGSAGSCPDSAGLSPDSTGFSPGSAGSCPGSVGSSPDSVGAGRSNPGAFGPAVGGEDANLRLRLWASRPWRRRFRLAGDPVLAGPRREGLIARGVRPGGRGAVVAVLGADLGQMLVNEWTARSFGYGAPPFRDWISGAVASPPLRIDLPRVAAAWRGRVGVGRVHIVMDLDSLPRLVRVRRIPAGAPPVSADATDLARRVGRAMGLLAVPPVRRELLHRVLLPRLVAAGVPAGELARGLSGVPAGELARGAALVLPPRLARRAARQASRMRDELLGGGYPIHGNLDDLLPTERPGVPEPSDDGVLALGMRLLLDWAEA